MEPAGANLVGIHVPDGPLTAAALLWVQGVEVDALLLHAETPTARAVDLARRLGCSHLLIGSVDGDSLRLSLQRCESVGAKRRQDLAVSDSLRLGQPEQTDRTHLG